jgi:hypothetical protein
MLSLIEVQCPHCGAQGQIMVPPVGAVIIGPCPECKELVVVFCGQVLALNKETMEMGSVEERREHLLGVLHEFLEDRIVKILDEDTLTSSTEEQSEDSYEEMEYSEALSETPEFEMGETEEEPVKESAAPISQVEMERFMDVDLKLLDNKAYFKSVFG